VGEQQAADDQSHPPMLESRWSHHAEIPTHELAAHSVVGHPQKLIGGCD